MALKFSGYRYESTEGFVTQEALFKDIIAKIAGILADNGTDKAFDLKFPAALTGDETKAVFETSVAGGTRVDGGPWRILIDGTENIDGGIICVGCENQLPDDGKMWDKVAKTYTNTPNKDIAGILIGGKKTPYEATIAGGIPVPEDFYIMRPAAINPDTPYNYRLSVSARGLYLEMWQTPLYKETNFSWICIQRPVDTLTGAVRASQYAPTVCLYSLHEHKCVWKIIVRESDVAAPTIPVEVSTNRTYDRELINVEKQKSHSEDNHFYITFPAGINTSRHLYNEEMDMMAYTSAGVLSHKTQIQVQVYNEYIVRGGTGQNVFKNITNYIGMMVKGQRSTTYGYIRGADNMTSPTYILVGGYVPGYSSQGDYYSEFDPDELLQVIDPADPLNPIDIGKTAMSNPVEPYLRTYVAGNANGPVDQYSPEGMRVLSLWNGAGVGY